MKKILTPFLLLAIAVLCFSGSPASNKACHGTLIITDVDPFFFGITRVDITNDGTTTYYYNPTFPITQFCGGPVQVRFYFDANYHGAINLRNPCTMANFHDENAPLINFNTGCSTYTVELIPGNESTNYQCP